MKVLKTIEECVMAAILVPTAIGVVLCVLILGALAVVLAASAIIILS